VCSSDLVTFGYNASDALNQIIQGVLERGDHVITSRLEHNSVLRPLYHREREGDIEVTCLPFNGAGYLDPGDVRTAIRKNTKLVILNHASNVIGTVQPLAEIGRVCREAGVLFAVDASQTAGVNPIDMQAMQIDLLAFTGHKGLMGPTGIGGLCVADNVAIRPMRFGGTGVRSAERFHLEEFPHRLECGTLNILGVAGLYAGVSWLRKNDPERIHDREMALWDRLRRGLQAVEGVITYCAEGPADKIAVLSFNLSGWEAGDVGAILDADYDIACRTGLQCAPLVHRHLGTDRILGTIRFSLGPFNTVEDVDRAVAAVVEIAELRRR
jgi:cysteine desulfurase family protein